MNQYFEAAYVYIHINVYQVVVFQTNSQFYILFGTKLLRHLLNFEELKSSMINLGLSVSKVPLLSVSIGCTLKKRLMLAAMPTSFYFCSFC